MFQPLYQVHEVTQETKELATARKIAAIVAALTFPTIARSELTYRALPADLEAKLIGYLQGFCLPHPCATGLRRQGVEGRIRYSFDPLPDVEYKNSHPVSLADLAQMFQRTLSVARERRAIQNRNHDPRAGVHCRSLRGRVKREQERRRIGIARRQRRVDKRQFHFPGVRDLIDAFDIRIAGTPDFDHAAACLHPVACRRGRGVRGLPRRFLRTGTEHKRKETVLGIEARSKGHSQ